MSAEFTRPESIEAAVEALGEAGDKGKLIAGGTALALMLRQRLIAPAVLISLDGIQRLTGVSSSADDIRIGAMTRLRQVEASPEVRRAIPALAAACGEVGNVRVRNQATLGGNLAEADYASDPPTVLLALDASVRAVSPAGERQIRLSDFFQGFYTTALGSGEILTEILIPRRPGTRRTAYVKYRSRSSEDRPCVGVAAVAAFEDGVCSELGVAVGAACETPRRIADVEALAVGQPLGESVIRDIAEGYADGIETLEDLRGSSWYRTEMIRVFVRRALEEVASVGR